MRIEKTKTVQQEITLIERTVCDKCGCTIKEPEQWGVRDFELEFKVGEGYPEGGSAKGWRVDLCDPCVEWLRKALEDHGAQVQEFERHW